MYRVLIAIDSDEQRARNVAEAVTALPGRSDDIEAVILNVFKEFEVTGEGSVRSADLYDETSFPPSVGVAEERLSEAGIEATTRREHGDPAESILAVADELDADIIVVGGRKQSPAGKVLFGSVTQSVLLAADRPVLVTTRD